MNQNQDMLFEELTNFKEINLQAYDKTFEGEETRLYGRRKNERGQ